MSLLISTSHLLPPTTTQQVGPVLGTLAVPWLGRLKNPMEEAGAAPGGGAPPCPESPPCCPHQPRASLPPPALVEDAIWNRPSRERPPHTPQHPPALKPAD